VVPAAGRQGAPGVLASRSAPARRRRGAGAETIHDGRVPQLVARSGAQGDAADARSRRGRDPERPLAGGGGRVQGDHRGCEARAGGRRRHGLAAGCLAERGHRPAHARDPALCVLRSEPRRRSRRPARHAAAGLDAPAARSATRSGEGADARRRRRRRWRLRAADRTGRAVGGPCDRAARAHAARSAEGCHGPARGRVDGDRYATCSGS
jgi:hypothetical protein